MSFTISKTVTPDSAVGQLTKSGAEETVSVTYTVTNVSLTGTSGMDQYEMSIEGYTGAAIDYMQFTYSGTGNPITEAETALQASLTAS